MKIFAKKYLNDLLFNKVWWGINWDDIVVLTQDALPFPFSLFFLIDVDMAYIAFINCLVINLNHLIDCLGKGILVNFLLRHILYIYFKSTDDKNQLLYKQNFMPNKT